jgi:hypothetical protein
MNSSITASFRHQFRELPPSIQKLAKKNFRLWLSNSRHRSLHFKKVGDYWSVRVGDDHRALGRLKGGTLYWFWIGNHDEYERMIRE